MKDTRLKILEDNFEYDIKRDLMYLIKGVYAGLAIMSGFFLCLISVVFYFFDQFTLQFVFMTISFLLLMKAILICNEYKIWKNKFLNEINGIK